MVSLTTLHAGDDLECIKKEIGYNGKAHSVLAPVMADDGIVTADETAAVDFAHEIFKMLSIDSDSEISMWFDTFKYGRVREG